MQCLAIGGSPKGMPAAHICSECRLVAAAASATSAAVRNSLLRLVGVAAGSRVRGCRVSASRATRNDDVPIVTCAVRLLYNDQTTGTGLTRNYGLSNGGSRGENNDAGKDEDLHKSTFRCDDSGHALDHAGSVKREQSPWVPLPCAQSRQSTQKNRRSLRWAGEVKGRNSMKGMSLPCT